MFFKGIHMTHVFSHYFYILFFYHMNIKKYKEINMVVTLLSNAGHVLKDDLTYEMLYIMFEKINSDLNGVLTDEEKAIRKIFQTCEGKKVSVEQAVVKHTARITSYTNTAMFYARQMAR